MRLHAALLAALLGLTLADPAASQRGGGLDPAGTRRAEAAERIVATFAARLAADIAADSIGSIAAAVILGDSVVWEGAFGVADRQTGERATAATVYRAASITKVFTAAALLRLAEKGVVGMDEPVAARVPEIAGLAGFQARHRPITYRDLASHTAGLEREPAASHAARGRRSAWSRKTLASIPVTEVRSSPGAAYRYSNIGYAILGLALQRAVGKPYERVVTEEVLRPLGLARTGFSPPARGRGRLAAGYVNLSDGTVDPRVPRAEHRGRGYKLPSEGLYTTAGDLARLVMALSGAAGAQLLAPATRNAMLTDHAPDDDDRSGYGLGLQLTRLGDTLLAGHSGTVAGYSSYLAFDPASGAGVVILRSYNRGATNLAAEGQRLLLEIAAIR